MDVNVAIDKLVFDLEGASPTAIAAKSDRGGLTKWGVTDKEYRAHRKAWGLPEQSVQYMTVAEMRQIYKYSYWIPVGGGALPDGLDYAVFQAGVNIGPQTAVMMLQKVVGTTRDGVVGPKTLSAIKSMGTKLVTATFLRYQRAYYDGVVARYPDQVDNLNGWNNRVSKVEQFLAENKRAIGGTLFLIVAAFLVVNNS